MSRSASCMSELIRQELSDYVDNKSEHLPSLVSSSSQIIDKQKLSFNTEVNLTQMSGEMGKRKGKEISIDFSAHTPNASDNIQLTGKNISQSNSKLLTKSTSVSDMRAFSLPTPPALPKPSSLAKNTSLVRRHRARMPNSMNNIDQ